MPEVRASPAPAPQAAQGQALLEEQGILSLFLLSCQEQGQSDHVCLAGSADGPRCSFHPASPTHAAATAVRRASASTGTALLCSECTATSETEPLPFQAGRPCWRLGWCLCPGVV